MKAMRLIGLKQLSMFEIPAPRIKNDTDVLIKMTHVGVCGSDVHYYNHGKIGKQSVEYPFTLGHEGSGIVESVGALVTRVKPGDRIAIDPAMPCKECDQCKSGRSHTCRKLKFLGCPRQAEGCLSEYIVMPESSCFHIPENLTLEDASLSEPLCVGYYGVKLSQIKPGANIGIFGSGPIGLSVLVSSKLYAPGNIYMTDKLDYRLGIAKKSGATWTGNIDKINIVGEITSQQPELLDIVYECCGKQEAIDQAITLLKPGGKLMIIGIPEGIRYSFSVDEMRHKELCIQNVRRQNDCVDECLEYLQNGKIKVSDWVTHRFSLRNTKDAFELVSNYHDGVFKAMIEI
jgi:L-iditol 2-dehydrogenase